MTDTARPAPQHDTLGTVALVLAVVATLGHVAQAGLSAALPAIALERGASLTDIAGLYALIGALLLIVSLAAAVLGAIGLSRAGRPTTFAAIALGAGGAGSVVGVAGLLLPPLVGAILA